MSPVLARGWQHRGRRVPAVAAWCVRPPMSSIHLRKLRRRGLVAHGTGWRGTWRGSAARRPRDRPPSSSERQRRQVHSRIYGRAPWAAYLGLSKQGLILSLHISSGVSAGWFCVVGVAVIRAGMKLSVPGPCVGDACVPLVFPGVSVKMSRDRFTLFVPKHLPSRKTAWPRPFPRAHV